MIFPKHQLAALLATTILTGCVSLNLSLEREPERVLEIGEWQTLSTESYKGKRDDISFVDMNTGWYGTGGGDLFRTIDGGATWQKISERPGTFIRALGFIDENTGFIGNIGTEYYPGVTDQTPLYRTDDGGVTWRPVETGELIIAGVCAIDILKTERIYQGTSKPRIVIHAAGRVGGPAQILRSLDEGQSWSVIDLSAQAGMILDVKFHSEFEGLVFASSSRELGETEGLILRTSDGGKTWKEVYRSGRSGELIWKASFPSRYTGYATVQSYDRDNPIQRIVKTVDGGRSWEELILTESVDARQFGIGFVDTNTGFVGTLAGGFMTDDGGRTWSSAPLAKAANNFSLVKGDQGAALFAIGTEVQRLDLHIVGDQ